MWSRPPEVPLPSVWGVVPGRHPMANGVVPNFRIQDATPDLDSDLILHMQTIFLRDEPLCDNLQFVHHLAEVEEAGRVWTKVLQMRTCLVALVDNWDELGDTSLPKLAGCNMTFPVEPTDDWKIENPRFRAIYNLMEEMCIEADCFNKYNVPVILSALGLSVDPVYRGQGLAESLLKARFPLCKALGIRLTSTVFSNPKSQIPALKAGFQSIVERQPDDYRENGRQVFKGVEYPSMLMVAQIE